MTRDNNLSDRETVIQATNAPLVAGVIGWPIAHSRSPLIHNYWLEKHGISGHYAALEIEPDDLEVRLESLAEQGLQGVNATIPHKEAVFALADTLSADAKAIGAVNTLVFEGGKKHGFNTDASGFIASLAEADGDWRAATALVLGAGGAARAIVYGLLKAGMGRVVVVNRTRARAEAMAADLVQAFRGHGEHVEGRIGVQDWSGVSGAMTGASLLVNATSLGMSGHHPLEVSLDHLPPNAVVTDIVYAPLETELLRIARSRANPVVDGLGMLLHQARFAFEAWFGILPDVDKDLRDRIVADLQS